MSAKQTKKQATKRGRKPLSERPFSMIEINKAVKAAKKAPRKRAMRIQYITPELTKFESNIPIPPPSYDDVGNRKEGYPFARLAFNDSFSYPLVHNVEGQKRQRTNLIAAITAFEKQHPDSRLVFRMLTKEGLIRVWRVANTSEQSNTDASASSNTHAAHPSNSLDPANV